MYALFKTIIIFYSIRLSTYKMGFEVFTFHISHELMLKLPVQHLRGRFHFFTLKLHLNSTFERD